MKPNLAQALLAAMLLPACTTTSEPGAELTALREQVASLERRLEEAEARSATPSTTVPEDGVLTVRRLVVEDDAGRERIVLGSDLDGALLSMYDAEEKRRAFLQVDQHRAPRLVLLDREEKWRFHASLIHGDAPYVGFWGGKNREKKLRIEAPIDGAVGMGMWGGPGAQNETSHAGFYVWEDGTIAWGGGLRSAGRTGFILKYRRDGTSEFELRDAEERRVWSLPPE